MVCAVLARCDERAPKTAGRKPPPKATRVSHRVNRGAASRKGNGVRKVNKASKVSKVSKAKGTKAKGTKAKDAKGSMLTLASMDSKTANIKVVTSHRNLARGRLIAAR